MRGSHTGPSARPHPFSRRLLYLGTGIAIAAILLAAIGVLAYLRQQAEERLAVTTQTLSKSVEQTIEGMVDGIDYALQVSADEIAHQLASGRPDRSSITDFMAKQQARVPHLDLLRATNEAGEAIYGAGVPTPPVSNASRPYFKRLRDDPAAGMVLSAPIIGAISQKWIWLMARRFNRPDGSFGGVVYGSVFIDDIVRMFEAIKLAPGSVIVLRDRDLGLIARSSFDSAPPLQVGEQANYSLAFRKALLRNASEGTYDSGGGTDTVDGVRRVYSYRHNARHGFTVVVGASRSAAMAAWNEQATMTAVLVGAFALALLMFARQTDRAWRRRDEDMAALVASRKLLHSAQKLASVGQFTYDLGTDRWTGSDILDDILGIDANHPRDQGRWWSVFAPESRADMQARWSAIAQRRTPIDVECRIVRHRDGVARWVHCQGQLQLDGEGNPAAVFGTIQDIDERKSAEQALRYNHDQIMKVLELNPLPMALVDRDGTIDYVNRKAVATFGYRLEDVPTLDAWRSKAYPDPAYRARVVDRWATQAGGAREHGREIGPDEYQVTCKDGSVRTTAISGVWIADKLLLIFEDVTAHKVLEATLDEARVAAEAASHSKSTFLANMSHEIRTPMNGILGMAHLLRRGGVTPLQGEQLDKIATSGRHLLGIINDILDLAKIEAGRLTLNAQDFTLPELLHGVTAVVGDGARAKGLSLRIDVAGMPTLLRGDETRLRQALLNFLGNAVKFTERGSVTLRGRLLDETDDGYRLRFEVVDTGIGIPETVQRKLFTPFVQADDPRSRARVGTGLGLTITREIAQLMGGEVGFASAPGKGSTFWMTVQVAKGRSAPAAAAPESAESAEASLRRNHGGTRILLAEDDPINQEVALELLHGAGLAPDLACDGREAVRMARDTDYALILMDVHMPMMDGLEATRIIRAMPGRGALPIIAKTANAFDEDRRACAAAGMDDFIPKPLEPEQLFATLLKWLDRLREPAAAGVAPDGARTAGAPNGD